MADPAKIEDDGSEEKVTTSKKRGKDNYKEIKPGPGRKSRQMASFWLDQIIQYNEDREPYVKTANRIVKRFRDERNLADDLSDRRMNMLWANTKIMLPAIYSKCPIPIIDRKFLDKDQIGRLSSMMAERAVRNEIDYNGFHSAMRQVVLDRLLAGMGTLWVRYESEIEKSSSIPSTMHTVMEDELVEIEGNKEEREDPKEEALEDTGEQIVRESVPVDYIHWSDFYMFPVRARNWQEVQAVGKRVMISREEAKERFGEDIGEEMQVTQAKTGSSLQEQQSRKSMLDDMTERSIVVYEIWNKLDRKVYWVSDGYQYLCDVRDDPLELTRFFPCPKPLFATTTTNTLIPVPDYTEWEDQAMQIDELTRRLAMLVRACRVAGTYDAQNSALARVLDEGKENNLIPVDNWALYAEKGGITGAISFVPLKEIQSVIETLINSRSLAMQDLDTVTGINEVMRGTTDSRETLGGIRLKNNNTGTRLSESQNDVADFARDAIRIVTEIICKHFSKDTLVDCSNILYEDELDKDVIIQGLKFKLATSTAPPPQGAPQAPPAGGQPPQGPIPPPPGAQAPGAQAPGSNVVPFTPPPMSPQIIQQMLEQQAETIIDEKIDKAIELLREDIPRRYRIDIETDSTVFADANQEKQNAVDFIQAFSQFITSAEQISQNLPEAMPLMGKMLEFGVRKFRTGRDLEYAINEFIDQVSKKAAQMIANPKPNPDVIKQQIEQAKLKGEISKQQIAAKAQADNDQRDAQKSHMEAQQNAALIQAEVQSEQQKAAFAAQLAEREFKMRMIEMDREEQLKMAEFNRKMHELTLKHEVDKDKHEMEKSKIAKKEAENGKV